MAVWFYFTIFFDSPEIDIILLYAQIIRFLGNGLLPVNLISAYDSIDLENQFDIRSSVIVLFNFSYYFVDIALGALVIFNCCLNV